MLVHIIEFKEIFKFSGIHVIAQPVIQSRMSIFKLHLEVISGFLGESFTILGITSHNVESKINITNQEVLKEKLL